VVTRPTSIKYFFMAYRDIKTYQVYVQGKAFTLYEEQIRYDAPNAITEHFDQPHPWDPKQSAPPMQLARDPILFGIIVQYLSGYEVLPLSENGLPPGMTIETAMKNLIKDADALRLRNLVKLLKKPTFPPHVELASWAGLNSTLVSLEDLVDEEFEPTEGDLYWHSRNDILSGANGLPVLVFAKNIPIQYVSRPVCLPVLTNHRQTPRVCRHQFRQRLVSAGEDEQAQLRLPSTEVLLCPRRRRSRHAIPPIWQRCA
jgi:hypothetical protein